MDKYKYEYLYQDGHIYQDGWYLYQHGHVYIKKYFYILFPQISTILILD